MIKEIVAQITCACGTGAVKTDDLEILFRMASGYFDEEFIEAIESAGCKVFDQGKRIANARFSSHGSIHFIHYR